MAPYDEALPLGLFDVGPTAERMRGNFCGIRVPGLTEGGNDKDPSLMILWDKTRYSDHAQDLSLNYMADVCGYTHDDLSIPQTKNQGLGIDALRKAAKKSKTKMPYLTVQAFGGDGEDFDRDVKPWLDALYGDGSLRAGDAVCVCWQANFHYSPMDLMDCFFRVRDWAKPKGIRVVIQWACEADAWWDDATCAAYGVCDRFSYQAFMGREGLDGHLHQCDTEADLSEIQSGLVKILISLPDSVVLTMCENTAQAQYDNPMQRLELYGDMKGRLCMAAHYGSLSTLMVSQHVVQTRGLMANGIAARALKQIASANLERNIVTMLAAERHIRFGDPLQGPPAHFTGSRPIPWRTHYLGQPRKGNLVVRGNGMLPTFAEAMGPELERRQDAVRSMKAMVASGVQTSALLMRGGYFNGGRRETGFAL